MLALRCEERREGGWGGWGCLCSRLLRAAGGAWQQGEGTTRQGPRWHSDGNILQLPSGSFVCFIKQLQTLRCFTAVYAALPGGTFTTVLYGQIICNIEALMTTWNYPCFGYGTLRRWQGQETALHGCRPVRVRLGGRRRVTFGTRRLFLFFFFLSFPSRDSDTSHTWDEMLPWSNERQKNVQLNMPESMSNPHILHH